MIMIEYSNGQKVTIEEFRAKHKNIVFGKKPSSEFLASIDASFVTDTDLLAKETRSHRNRLLAQSDWTQVSDAPVDQAAWATYRQALRDVPQQADFPLDVTWPTAPT